MVTKSYNCIKTLIPLENYKWDGSGGFQRRRHARVWWGWKIKLLGGTAGRGLDVKVLGGTKSGK